MKEIVFVTRRIKINGQQEIVEEFVAEKAKEIMLPRAEAAVESFGYERTQK